METASLDDLMAFNDQLGALIEAGVPLDLDLGTRRQEVAATLERINAAVARRVCRGASLAEALEGDPAVAPAAYRALVLFGLRVGNLYAGLEGAQRLARSVEKSRYGVRAAFVYPLVVCSLAFLGIVGFCLFYVPTLQDTYAGMGLQPRSGLRVLQWLRGTLPYWVAVPPMALLLIMIGLVGGRWRRRSTGERPVGLWGRLSGALRADFEQRCAHFAHALADLLSGDAPLDANLRIAGMASGDARLRDAAQLLAASLEHDQVPGDDHPAALRFPPFLRWALLHSESATGRASALRMAGNVYQRSAERHAEQSQVVTPIVACAVVGGGAVLLYGLMLFVPVVELLEALGASH